MKKFLKVFTLLLLLFVLSFNFNLKSVNASSSGYIFDDCHGGVSDTIPTDNPSWKDYVFDGWFYIDGTTPRNLNNVNEAIEGVHYFARWQAYIDDSKNNKIQVITHHLQIDYIEDINYFNVYIIYEPGLGTTGYYCLDSIEGTYQSNNFGISFTDQDVDVPTVFFFNTVIDVYNQETAIDVNSNSKVRLTFCGNSKYNSDTFEYEGYGPKVYSTIGEDADSNIKEYSLIRKKASDLEIVVAAFSNNKNHLDLRMDASVASLNEDVNLVAINASNSVDLYSSSIKVGQYSKLVETAYNSDLDITISLLNDNKDVSIYGIKAWSLNVSNLYNFNLTLPKDKDLNCSYGIYTVGDNEITLVNHVHDEFAKSFGSYFKNNNSYNFTANVAVYAAGNNGTCVGSIIFDSITNFTINCLNGAFYSENADVSFYGCANSYTDDQDYFYLDDGIEINIDYGKAIYAKNKVESNAYIRPLSSKITINYLENSFNDSENIAISTANNEESQVYLVMELEINNSTIGIYSTKTTIAGGGNIYSIKAKKYGIHTQLLDLSENITLDVFGKTAVRIENIDGNEFSSVNKGLLCNNFSDKITFTSTGNDSESYALYLDGSCGIHNDGYNSNYIKLISENNLAFKFIDDGYNSFYVSDYRCFYSDSSIDSNLKIVRTEDYKELEKHKYVILGDPRKMIRFDLYGDEGTEFFVSWDKDASEELTGLVTDYQIIYPNRLYKYENANDIIKTSDLSIEYFVDEYDYFTGNYNRTYIDTLTSQSGLVTMRIYVDDTNTEYKGFIDCYIEVKKLHADLVFDIDGGIFDDDFGAFAVEYSGSNLKGDSIAYFIGPDNIKHTFNICIASMEFFYNQGDEILSGLSIEEDEYINVGEYAAYLAKEELGDYANIYDFYDEIPYIAFLVYVVQASNSIESLSIESWKANETASLPVASAKHGDVEFLYAVKGSDEFISTKPTEPGEYTLMAYVEETDNYTSAEETVEFTIYKGSNSIESLSIENWKVNETASLPVASAKHGDVKFLYAVKGTNEYKSTKPTEPGKYTLKAYVEESKYFEGAEKTVDFIIYQDNMISKSEEDGNLNSNQIVQILSSENGIDPDWYLSLKLLDNENSDESIETVNVLKSNDYLKGSQKVAGIYDVKLLLDGVEKQPDGNVTFKMLVPENVIGKEFTMYHIHYFNDEEYEIIPITDLNVDEDGFITFTTDKLSYFVFVASEFNPIWILVGVLALLVLLVVLYLLGYFFLYRPGKLDDKNIKVIYIFLPKKKEEN